MLRGRRLPSCASSCRSPCCTPSSQPIVHVPASPTMEPLSAPQHPSSHLAKLLATLGCKVPACEAELAALVATTFSAPALHNQQIIGHGGFALVCSVQSNGQQTAVKVMRHALAFPEFLVEANMWAAEVLVMSRANHPNVLTCLGWDIVEEAGGSTTAPQTPRLFRMRIFMPLMIGSLEDLAKDPALDPDRLLRLFCQASAGLRHLHDDLRVLHNDVKAANVLLDQGGNAVVADFGLVCDLPLGAGGVPDPRGHTKGYAAPERQGCVVASVLAPRGYRAFACPASDVWALAMELARLYRRVPAAHRPNGDPQCAPEFVRLLLSSCMARQPELRMTAAELESALRLWTDTRRVAASRLVAAAFARACPAGAGAAVASIYASQPAASAAVCELSVCLDALSMLGSVVAVSTIMFSSDVGGGSSSSSDISSHGGDDFGDDVDHDGNNDEHADLNNLVGSDTDCAISADHSSGSDVSSSSSSHNNAWSRRSPLLPSQLVLRPDVCQARKRFIGLHVQVTAV